MKTFQVSFQLFKEVCKFRLHKQCMHCGNPNQCKASSCCYNECPLVAEAGRQKALEEINSNIIEDPCQYCGGTGRTHAKECPACKGSGNSH